jgi:hypothetical protein
MENTVHKSEHEGGVHKDYLNPTGSSPI